MKTTSEITWRFVGIDGTKAKPKLILETREETLAYLAGPQPSGIDKYATCSIYLCDFMDELEKSGFVYNAAALRAFEKAHNLPESPENGSPLSILIYNCQSYRRARALENDGWQEGSQELLREAHESGQGILRQGHNFIGMTVEEILKVREIEGRFYAMQPRKRKWAVNIDGKPCKIVPLNTTPKTAPVTVVAV